jgi:hypothetical protein
MYTVTPYKTEIRLISNLNGLVNVYADYESFLENINYAFVTERIVTTFRDWPVRWDRWWKFGEPYERFVVRDKFGSAFSSNEILNDLIDRNYERYKGWWFLRKHNYVFRQTPVPRTGKRKGYFKYYYKRPKTTQEKRWSYADKEFVRGKRRAPNLPDSWDDFIRGDIKTRKSWKSKKIKKQWMKNQRA